jgi:hypothetical protein
VFKLGIQHPREKIMKKKLKETPKKERPKWEGHHSDGVLRSMEVGKICLFELFSPRMKDSLQKL